METKKCSRCGKILAIEMFKLAGKYFRQSRCLDCSAEHEREDDAMVPKKAFKTILKKKPTRDESKMATCLKCGELRFPGSFISGSGIGTGIVVRHRICVSCRQERYKRMRRLESASRSISSSSNKRAPSGAGMITQDQARQKMDVYGWRCWFCGEDAVGVDHVKPMSKGGKNIIANCLPCCKMCNYRKGAKLLSLQEMHRVRLIVRAGG